ncbi:MAG TPA: alpha-ketoacid dehydrogenase subunit beta [Streptosporangiaceae bacterium]|nr:alpha-ketoacid dehydrogenase subunit beta [Streptosporangiaceae bacterium]
MTVTKQRSASQGTTFAAGIARTLADVMRADDRVIVFGEDVGRHGGVFRATSGLYGEFGPARVRDTPICESAIVGTALGCSLMGARPVVEIQYSDFLTECMDQIVNQAAKVRYMSGGQLTAPMVIRTPGGRSRSAAAQHSQSLESWFTNIPGLLVVGPSNVADACGMLRSAIESEDPVLFFEHKLLYRLREELADVPRHVQLGQAAVCRPGTDVTVVSWSWMVHESLKAAETVTSASGASVEVIDLRSLVPLDIATVVQSVRKTGRLVVAHEAPIQGGWGSDVVAAVVERAWAELASPPVRVGAVSAPVPMAPRLESAVLPDSSSIVSAITRVLASD